MSASPQRPLDGARILILSADPSAVEPLSVALEDAGAELSVRFVDTTLPEPESLDGVVLHDSFGLEHWDTLQAFLSQLPASVPVVDADEDTFEVLVDELAFDDTPDAAPVQIEPALQPATSVHTADEADAAEHEELQPGRGRLLRTALTVVVVTLLLWLAFGRFARPADETLPVAPATGGAGAGQQAAGTGELAGRVTRADTNGSIGGATVVATGPSGPIATITDSQGRWRFSGLRGGTYVVMSTVARFVAKQVQVEVPEGRAVENVNLSLDPEAP